LDCLHRSGKILVFVQKGINHEKNTYHGCNIIMRIKYIRNNEIDENLLQIQEPETAQSSVSRTFEEVVTRPTGVMN
jgi:hypothetical protein